MNIKDILKAHGVESDKIEAITDSINQEIPKEFVSKKQYSKKVAEIETLNGTIADLEAKGDNSNTDEWKSKYEAKETEFNDYKTQIETEKVNSDKTNKLTQLLKSNGVTNDKLANLLLKNVDLTTIELENDTIKGADSIIEGFKTYYNDFFTKTTVVGNPPATPPTNTNTETDPFLKGFGI